MHTPALFYFGSPLPPNSLVCDPVHRLFVFGSFLKILFIIVAQATASTLSITCTGGHQFAVGHLVVTKGLKNVSEYVLLHI